MKRGGPDAVTFAAVAAEIGLAPATLVQRFPTKDLLKRAALLRAWDHLDAETARWDAQLPVTAAGAIALLVALSDFGEDDDYADGLLLLREDMRDPVLRLRGDHWGEALAQALGRRLTEDAAQQKKLGRLMASQWQGTLVWWGFSRNGSIRDAVVEALLAWWEIAGPDKD